MRKVVAVALQNAVAVRQNFKQEKNRVNRSLQRAYSTRAAVLSTGEF